MNHRYYNELKSMVKEAMAEAIAKEAGYINNELAGDLLRTLGKRARNVTPKSSAFHNGFAPAQNQAKLDFLGDERNRGNAARYLAAKAQKPTYAKAQLFGGQGHMADTMTGKFQRPTVMDTAVETRAPSRSVRNSYDSAMGDAKQEFLRSRGMARHTADRAMLHAKLGRPDQAALGARVAKEESVGSYVIGHANRYQAAKNGRPQYRDIINNKEILRDTLSRAII